MAEEQMTSHTKAAYKAYFRIRDTDLDGKLGFDEFYDLCCDTYSEPPTKQQILAVFEANDVDHNHKVDFEEFLKFARDLPPIEELFRKEFKKFDSNGDNLITKSEFQVAMMKLGYLFKKEKVTELIDSVDTDGDGKLNFEEFIKLLPTMFK